MELKIDGKRVFAATGGRPFKVELPSVVFVHGAGMDHTVWTLQTRWFAHHGRNVLAVDLPGHGRSEGPALTSIESLADWIIRFLDAGEVKKAALIGHSMGGLIALEAAARAPARVWALGLLGVSGRMAVHPDLLKAATTNDHAAIDLVASWGFGRRAHLGGARPPGIWMMGSGVRLLEHGSAGMLGIDLAACDAYAGAPAAAAKLSCPTLVIVGESDRMTSLAAAQDLTGKIAGAQLVAVAGAGHMTMVEAPDRTLDALAGIV
ncbi:MAG: alpha/beta hydrolase [Rhodospirillales bacterium]|nr:alpha/beta hydrolase [Rhodospirillales bacterium]